MDNTIKLANMAYLEDAVRSPSKVAANFSQVLQIRLRETGRARKILAPTMLDNDMSQCNVTNREGDSPLIQYRMQVDPDALSIGGSMLGRPDTRYFRLQIVYVTLEKVVSERIKLNDADVRLSNISVPQTLEERLAKQLQETEDEQFSQIIRQGVTMATYYRALTKYGQTISSHTLLALYLFTKDVTYNGGAWPAGIPAADVVRAKAAHANIILLENTELTKSDFVDLKKIATVNENDCTVFFLHKSTMQDIEKWDANTIGYDRVEEVVKNGWTSNKLLGVDFVWTIRDNDVVIRPGEIFVFPPAEFMGVFVEMADPVVFMTRTSSSESEFEMSEQIGIGIKNSLQIGYGLLAGHTGYLVLPPVIDAAAPFWQITNDYTVTSLTPPTTYAPSKGQETL